MCSENLCKNGRTAGGTAVKADTSILPLPFSFIPLHILSPTLLTFLLFFFELSWGTFLHVSSPFHHVSPQCYLFNFFFCLNISVFCHPLLFCPSVISFIFLPHLSVSLLFLLLFLLCCVHCPSFALCFLSLQSFLCACACMRVCLRAWVAGV